MRPGSSRRAPGRPGWPGSTPAPPARFQAAKNQAGLASSQVRDYTARYRHITLAMLAHAYLSVTRAAAEKMTCGGTPSAQVHRWVRRLLELEEAPDADRRRIGHSPAADHLRLSG